MLEPSLNQPSELENAGTTEHSQKPLAIDLFTGLHGWGDGLVAEGYRVVGFDLEDMCGQFGIARHPDISLVIQDVMTLHGSQFRNAALIVASPPCQEYSYMAMPWTRAKQIAREYRDGTRERTDLTALFDACFRLQREACEAARRHIPLVVENVRGAQEWVGRSRWAYGSFHLWGDVPALMPPTHKGAKNPGFRFDGSGKSFQSESVKNTGGYWFNIGSPGQKVTNKNPASKGSARKMASAMIAKIPLPLSSYIARVFHPASSWASANQQA